MLWQIGAFILIIDIFYRISVPVDQLFQLTNQERGPSTANGTTPNDAGIPNAIIINDKGVAMLLERLSLATPEKQKLWLQSLQRALGPEPTTVRTKQKLSKQRKNGNPKSTTHHQSDVKMGDSEGMARLFTLATDNPDETEAHHSTKKPEPNEKQTVFKNKDGTQSLSEGIYHGKEVGPDGGKDYNTE